MSVRTGRRRTKAELQASLREQEARQSKRAAVTRARIDVLDAVEKLNKLKGK
jgi:hypothetical protein